MSLQNPKIKVLRVNSIQNNTNILPNGQPLYDKTAKRFYVGDGQTQIKDLEINCNNADYATNVSIYEGEGIPNNQVHFEIGNSQYTKTINNVSDANNAAIASKAEQTIDSQPIQAKLFDKVIRTQQEFNALISTEDWGGAHSVAYDFYDCKGLSNCRGSGKTSNGSGYIFYNCSYCNNCRASDTPTTAIWGGTKTKVDTNTCD